MHKNWAKSDIMETMQRLAQSRKLENLTAGPILSWNNEKIKSHIDAVLELEGSYVLWGGKPLTGHNIPDCYGSYEPTAIYVPLKHWKNNKKAKLLNTELFGPFQIISDYSTS